MQTAFDFTSQAIERAYIGQESKCEGWQDRAYLLLCKYSVISIEFITEDFREWAELNGLEAPKEPRAYGALIRRAVASKVIRSTNQFRKTNNQKSHSRPMMVWVFN